MTRKRLKAAWEVVAAARRDNTPAEGVIALLEKEHAAKRRQAGGAYHLRCAGVASSCTWSRDKGLLDGWYRNASLRLIQVDGR